MILPPCHTRGPHTTDEWITPRWLIERLGPFDLDPCAAVQQPWPCAKASYTENGLFLPWHGLVWCNPPYGKQTGAWLDRLSGHGNGIALVFARTETKMFFRYVWPLATSLLFLRGRLTFHKVDGTPAPHGHNSGGPSVLIAYGRQASQRLFDVADLGALVTPPSPFLPPQHP